MFFFSPGFFRALKDMGKLTPKTCFCRFANHLELMGRMIPNYAINMVDSERCAGSNELIKTNSDGKPVSRLKGILVL